ncbi:MAG: hypothetical protein CSB46_08105 [Micrococcales bacterium]|nr:MAG: hypothetical protein CSB46_08105 [Micrococcales bacterium]
MRYWRVSTPAISAAFARIVAVGRAHGDAGHPGDCGDSHKVAESAARLVRMAEQLEAAAGLWRRGDLH